MHNEPLAKRLRALPAEVQHPELSRTERIIRVTQAELRPPALPQAPDHSSEPVSLPAALPEAALDVPDDSEPLLSQLPEPSQLQLSQPDSGMCSQLLMSQLVAPAPTVVLGASVAQALSELATKLLHLGTSPSALPTEFDQLVAASDVHPVRPPIVYTMHTLQSYASSLFWFATL